MPDLTQMLMQRPAQNGAPNLPQGSPTAPEALINRFVGGLLQGPGVPQRPGAPNEIPEAMGAVTQLAIPAFIGKLLGSVRTAQTAAPSLGHKAMQELEDVMANGGNPLAIGTPNVKPNFSYRMREFAPITEGQRPPLTLEEANKMMALQQPSVGRYVTKAELATNPDILHGRNVSKALELSALEDKTDPNAFSRILNFLNNGMPK